MAKLNWRKFIERKRNQTAREYVRSPFIANGLMNCEVRSHYLDNGEVSDERVYDIFIYPDEGDITEPLGQVFEAIAQQETELAQDSNDRLVTILANIRGRSGRPPNSGVRNELSGKSAASLMRMFKVLVDRFDTNDAGNIIAVHVSFYRPQLAPKEAQP